MSTATSRAYGQGVGSSGAARRSSLLFRYLWWSAALVTGVLVLLATNGLAKAGEPRIAALSLAAIPDDATVEIRLPDERPSDDLGITVQLANHLAILLAERGYRPVDDAGELIVRFVAEEPTYAFRDDTPESGLLPVSFEREQRLTQSDPDRLRLRISVTRATRPPLWTGVIERLAKGGERSEAYLGMADALMKHWGTTFDGR